MGFADMAGFYPTSCLQNTRLTSYSDLSKITGKMSMSGLNSMMFVIFNQIFRTSTDLVVI